MDSQPNLISRIKALFIGPDIEASVPDMTREELASLKAKLFGKLDDGDVLGVPPDRFSVSARDLINLIQLAEKYFALEDRPSSEDN